MFADTARELRANAFAGHFLMPERGVRSVLEWLGEQPGQVGERRIRRAPERLTRQALAAAREQRLGLSAVSSLLERDDDELPEPGIVGMEMTGRRQRLQFRAPN